MDQPNSATSTSQPPTEPPPSQPPPQPHPPPSSATTTAPPTPTPTPIPPSPNPNPNPKPSTPSPPPPLPTPSQPRPPSTLARPWPQSHFAHFPPPNSSASSGPPPPSPSPSASTPPPPPPRGGMAIGVPAHHPGPSPPQSASFSSSYGHHFGGLSRSVPEPVTNSSAPQARPAMQGMPGMGMMGSLGSSSQMRAVGISANHQQRPGQSPLRPPSAANNQSPSPPNFQGHSLVRASSGGSTSSPSTSQGFSPHTQPWLSSGSQGKPPMPSPAYRQQVSSPSLQQRSHLPQQQHHPLPTVSPSASQQQHHSVPSASQQQHHPVSSASQLQHHPVPSASQQQHHPMPSASQQQHHPMPSASQQQLHPIPSASQQQHHPMPSASQQQHHPRPSASQQQHHPMPLVPQQQYTSSAQHQQPSHLGHENFGQQVQPRVPQTTPRQQHITRVQGHLNPKSSSPAVQPNTAQAGPSNKTTNTDLDESCTRILGKRKIHELFNQIDPYQQLDPEVEEILMDIADEFVESITTFSCSLAKHRKSNTLEAKDILLHVEKNWNITLPGFGGDEIKGVRKPVTNDIHKERLAVIKKSIVATDTANARNSTGQATGNAKGSLVKAPANIINSQNIKMREVT